MCMDRWRLKLPDTFDTLHGPLGDATIAQLAATMVVALLAGGAYAPDDPEWPEKVCVKAVQLMHHLILELRREAQ